MSETFQKIISDAVYAGMYKEPAYLFTIDSDDVTVNGNYDEFKVSFVDLPKYSHVSLLTASIPKSYYMIQSGANSFLVNDQQVTIPPGNYSQVSLKAELTTQLNALGLGSWIVNYSATTGKYTFLNSTFTSFTFTNQFFKRVGFDLGTYTPTAGSLTSIRQIDLQLTSCVVVKLSILEAKQQNSINQNILMTIPDTSLISSPVTWIHPDPHGCRIPINRGEQSFTVSMLDNSNQPLGLQSGVNLVLAFY